MASTLSLIGSITIDLLNENVEWQLAEDGYQQREPEYKQIRRESVFAEGSALVSSKAQNVIETYRVHLEGASHDAIAVSLQNLATLQAEARNYHTTRWQQTPVYLSVKTLSETNTRYALVYDIRIALPKKSMLDKEFANEKYWGDILVTIEREPYWRSAVPGSLPTALTIGAPDAPGTKADGTIQFIANYRQTNVLTHVYNFDASLAAFSANLIANSNFNLFEVSGSTPAVGDIMYFGSTDGVFFNAILNITTVGVATGVTFVVEYWNGAWATTSALAASELFAAGGVAGPKVVFFDGLGDWASTTINGVAAFWLRVRITAITAWTSSPVHSGQVPYSANNNYFSIANTALNGDADALGILKILKHIHTLSLLEFFVAGIKSRGLSNFTSRLNFGGQNPAGWGEAYGTDTSEVSDESAPGGSMARCTFATDQTLAVRATISVTSESIEPDFEGVYQIYLRCRMTTDDEVSVKLRVTHGIQVDGNVMPVNLLQLTGVGQELINMGRFAILPPGIKSGEKSGVGLSFAILASATSATPELELFDLILIPVDEWAMAISSGGLTDSLASTIGNRVIEADAGIRRNGQAIYKYIAAADGDELVMANYEMRGSPPLYPPDKALQVHCLFGGYSSSYGYSLNGHMAAVKAYAHQRWNLMRGAE